MITNELKDKLLNGRANSKGQGYLGGVKGCSGDVPVGVPGQGGFVLSFLGYRHCILYTLNVFLNIYQ